MIKLNVGGFWLCRKKIINKQSVKNDLKWGWGIDEVRWNNVI